MLVTRSGGRYINNSTAGFVSGYDVNYPSWGQSAEQAWGGIGESNNQGILTRAFISGGCVVLSSMDVFD